MDQPLSANTKPDAAHATAGSRSVTRRWRQAAAGAACLLLLVGGAGCASRTPRFAVEVNALADAKWKAQSRLSEANYILLPSDPETDARDLQHQEFERILELALADRGLRRVDDPARADIAVLMNYGVGEQETQLITFDPPYNAFDDYRYWNYGAYYGDRRRGHRRRGVGLLPYGRFSMVHRRSLGHQTRTITTVNRFLALEARDLSSGAAEDPRTGDPVWSTEVRSRGAIDDLRRVFPVLVSAAVEHIATDTGQILETTIAEDDERVVRLRPAAPEDAPNPESGPESTSTPTGAAIGGEVPVE